MSKLLEQITGYQFKRAEWLWILLIPGAIGLAGYLVDFRPEAVTDWKLYIMLAVGAIIRPVAAAALKLATGGFSNS